MNMKLKLLVFTVLFSAMSWGQISIPNTTTIVENFDSMAASATAALPANWKFSPAGAAAPTWAAAGNFTAVNQQASSGVPATGGRYNWGTTPATDRALGIMTSGSYASPNSIMAYYRNTNASNLTQLTVTYNLERYRVNTAAASVQFYYSLDGITWTAVTAGDVAAASLPTGASSYTFGTPLTINVASFNITGLNIATNSDIYLRWNLNTTGGNSQGIGIDDVNVTASFTVGCTQPTTQASAVTTNGETLDGFNVNWIAGTGNGTMIVVSDAAVVAPTSGTAYVPNLAWASAGQINTNNRVIFRGAGTTSGTITGLASGAQYTVSAYEYNTAGNCYKTPSAVGTGYTRALEPTAHAASFTCTTASSSQINLSFSAASTITNAAGYIILQSTTGVPTGVPTDGVFYTPGTVIGDATVVGYAAAAATTFNVTGLLPSTTYYFTLIPYGSYLSVAVTLNYNLNPTIPNTNCTTTGVVSANSDVLAIAASEAATISSTVNDAAPLTTSTGVQVWQFKVRDGGATLSDADVLPTIVNALTFAQSAGNQVTTWSDAINTIELFDGATRIAAGTVTANQVQFTGLTINVPDNTEKTLSVRLSLKCPMGAGAADGDDFGFSLSNANTTFSAAGSGKSAFAAQVSANGSNVIQVVATKLAFTTQPVSTGINATMANVVVTATDACGNKDKDFTGSVSITSTGTMTGSPISVSAVAGVATYATIVHTVLGTGLTLNATATGVTAATSNPFDITAVTAFSQGDFAVIGLNSNITCYPPGPNGAYSAGDDEISFMVFKDIQNGDTFYITDNGYERTTAGLWGDTEGVTQIIRTGGTIPAGTIITIRLRNVAPIMEFVSPDTSWSFAKAPGFIGSLVMNTGGDQIFFMQGGTWNNPGGTHDATYTPGTYLYAFNTNTAWNSLGASTQQSGLPMELRCFSLMPGTATDFLEYTGPTTPADKLIWIARLNNPSNWTNRVSCAGYTSMHVGQTYSVTNTGTFVNGVWTGAKSTDWFDCSNWQTLKVPDQTVNVDVNATYAIRDAVIDATSTNAPLYGSIAKSNDIKVSSNKVQIEGSTNNKLEVYGNLLIDTTGAIDMDDSNAATADGQIYLYGNWTNSIGNAAFSEGNGTVQFTGTGTQVINNVTPEGTETFYNVILNNNFNTGTSNNLIATGNLTVNATKTLDIASNGYVQVDNNLTNNGTVNVANNASLVQVNDSGVDTGNINVTRTASQRLLDYIYWSAPVINAPLSYFTTTGGTPASYIYSWGATTANPNGGEGYWNGASGNMVSGKGYIVRGSSLFNNVTPTSWNATFTGVPNNGIVTIGIQRGNDYTGLGTQGILRTAMDDNWNLIGNPYPSSLGVNEFLTANASIQGFVKIWTHGTLPTSLVDPFYQDFQTNYYATDYITVNGTGLTSGPGDYKIGAGQGFFVAMNPGAAGAATVTFNNSMRSRTFANNQFYKFAHANNSPASEVAEKNRIWLDLVGPNQVVTRTLVGYVSDATNEVDRLYDAVGDVKNNQVIYSVLNNEPFNIQGRKVPFDVLDTVPLGVKIPSNGTYTIAIAAVDGLFADKKQKIYIEDKLTNTVHDISQSPYLFSATQGIVNDRFVLRYTQPLKRDQFVDNAEINVFVSGNQIEMVSGSKAIKNYTVYNVLGQVLVTQEEVNKTTSSERSLTKNNQALIVKITFEDGQTATRKIVF